MTTKRAAKPKRDGRVNNGAVNRGLGEAAYLVRGPSDLFVRMAERAEREGWKLSDTWRRAAELFLAK